MPAGRDSLTVTASGGGITHTASLTWKIFGVTPLLGGAATSTDLGDLFLSFP